MFSSNIFLFSTKHRKTEPFFDIIMTINWGSNRIKDFLSNPRFFREVSNIVFVFISQFNYCFITKSFKIIDFNQSLKDREPMLCISNLIIAIWIYTCNFNFVTWPCTVNKIMKNNTFLWSRNTSWRHCTWCFLNCEFLMISINCFKLIEHIRAGSLTSNTSTCKSFCLYNSRTISRTFKIPTDTS